MITLDFIDAFITSQAFSGNPAAVIKTDHLLPETLMQQMAAQHNLSETAFIAPVEGAQGHFDIRWFTPTAKVDLCGHATLAAAYSILQSEQIAQVVFHTEKYGNLPVVARSDGLCMDFPVQPQRLVETPPLVLTKALPDNPREVFFGVDWLVVYDDPEVVLHAQPDMANLARAAGRGVILTAPGLGEFDFISRFFAPRYGIDEDPVTGSAHCALAPYWAVRLEKSSMIAWQASKRGGILSVEVTHGRVSLIGNCRIYSQSTIHPETLNILA